jgi:hypothetical protein
MSAMIKSRTSGSILSPLKARLEENQRRESIDVAISLEKADDRRKVSFFFFKQILAMLRICRSVGKTSSKVSKTWKNERIKT